MSAGEGFCGTAAILGRSNVGKSTLFNALLGEKVAIVAPKPQTTRNRILGVWSGSIGLVTGAPATAGQILLLDTPGVHEPRSALGTFMVRQAQEAAGAVDAALLAVEASARPATHEGERRILDRLTQGRTPTVLAINKVDRLRDRALVLPQIAAWNRLFAFAAIVPVSALRGEGIDDLRTELARLLPAGPPLHDPETVTDRSERFLAAELIREQLVLRLRQELPHATAVVVDGWQERPRQGDVVIDASIVVEQEGQKGIVVGRGGRMIRDLGAAARVEITRLLGRPAHLRLRVVVDAAWTKSPEALARLGYREES